MLFGLDGVEIGLIIVLLCLFGGILSGFPVAFAIGGAGLISFAIIAALDTAGVLTHAAVDSNSAAYRDLVNSGVNPVEISRFRYPDLPRVTEALFPGGWEQAMDRNLSFIVNRMNERVFAGASIETLLAVLMFVMMGIVLERSKIANDLLTTMARVFGPLPGGLAVSVVVVGAFLAASTGIVGATVVTMGLLSLPTMLRAGYSPQLATGVIAASGTLGQIIPPSIVIVLLGTLAGDLYATAQETRAQAAGCSDALTYLGEAAVVSVGTLFQAAILPGVLLAALYAAYAFGYAMLNPSKAPAVMGEVSGVQVTTRREKLTWFVAAPVLVLGGALLLGQVGLSGSQDLRVSNFTAVGESASLRTNVSAQCQASMIELHGQSAWDEAVAQRDAIAASGGGAESRRLTEDELTQARATHLAGIAPIGTGVLTAVVLFALILTTARGVAPVAPAGPLVIGAVGLVLALLADIALIGPQMSAGTSLLILALPLALTLYGCRYASGLLGQNELIRVVIPPLVLIVAVLGSILGGITNPTPAAALGAGGAIMLAAYRKLQEEGRTGRIIIRAAFAVVVMILIGANFDLRVQRDAVAVEDWIAYLAATAAFYFAMFGIVYSAWVLLRTGVLRPAVRETAKVTSMVFTILIGSQLLNLVVISFGGEHYIQDFLRSFDQEWVVFLLVMLVLFILGFVLDFLEIIYIVIPIVGPVIYGGTMDPKWVTIMIAVNLQTSFLTPPFGFALFYLRGVAPAEVTTGHIYRGIIPFVLIQVLGLGMLWMFPQVVTIVPNLMGH
ncbi:C4-dicarboxylate ABC transporter permease [Pacificitalea manganoxidans]|uniref:C4-dicarboxylate ABC transporter permease n=1 Tax=Pacificitalea manganoxidans TaxID=1411902 RepID=A0A291LYB0_9RHOB|nr:TRAP transporter large permease subunit [Pacificitalea manganoxidans]ATI41716.1 C4-dicarboxylate ABC transporter permease [Pacificitalea manganoxidans]MAQ47239.1 C4-dicarboxylate ABC transporter permease [Actibacterium sp.]MDR6309173.1 TRAP-type mannitol/chloroaromatic compound transport system permease large subunit [Pacificitalea manganoxidans]OWU67584.1 C4-dicarboxylate ABC transporter permease [Roseovarius sp. 22II1-1F6A]